MKFLYSITAIPIALTALGQATYVNINYTTVTGYFLQDDPATNASTFDYTATNFGLINRTYPADDACFSANPDVNLTQWQRFAHELFRLNHESPANTTYKLLFMGRHGEGWHNAAETYYGTPAWNCYWSLLNGNATASWADAALTPNGIAQALIANRLWTRLIATQYIPLPQSYYTSPLQRCLATANLTFSNLTLASSSSHFGTFKPTANVNVTVKELLREGISLHTCDRRHNASYIRAMYPHFTLEKGFVEEDVLWNGVTAETAAAEDVRSKTVLDDIFAHDSSSYVSVTSHSGEIASILRVLGHRVFGLNTGAVIPVLVRAVTSTQTGGAGTTTTPPWSVSSHCTAPPVTSLSTVSAMGGCVCPSGASAVTTPLITLRPFKI